MQLTWLQIEGFCLLNQRGKPKVAGRRGRGGRAGRQRSNSRE
jgi:hypothetical protein